MDAFVGELSHLYRLASAAPLEEFPERAVAQLRDWIDFDGAVFGFGESGENSLKIGSSAIYNRNSAIVDDYAAVSDTDPVTQRFIQAPERIVNVDTQATYTGKANRPVAQFSNSHDLRHLLLLGEEASDPGRMRWIVLYRGTSKAFDTYDAARLSVAWKHVLCALELNRVRALDLNTVPDGGRALALVSHSGAFEVVDPAFLNLLRQQWRDLPDSRLPPGAVLAMQSGKSFSCRGIEINFSRRGDYVVCEARAQAEQSRLSPREAQVADYFSLGHSYKEIAAMLGISPNTVRVQLARVYQKLEINDKAMLASSLAKVRRPPS
jgi:DNA-binding CsgD family transcriptional regulator